MNHPQGDSSRRAFLRPDRVRLGGRVRVPHDRACLGARTLRDGRSQRSDHPGRDRHRQSRLQRHQLVPRATTACRSSRSATSTARAPATGRARSAAASRPAGWSRSSTRRAGGRHVPRLRRRRRFPRTPGPQGHRRGRDLHPGPLARHSGARGLQGREGHLLPEAAVADDRRGPRDERRGQQVQARLPDRQPAAFRPAVPPRPANWSATAGSASCTRSASACRRAGPTTARPGDRKKPEPVPKGFDYDLWLGPAPEAPYAPRAATSTSAGSTTTPAAR